MSTPKRKREDGGGATEAAADLGPSPAFKRGRGKKNKVRSASQSGIAEVDMGFKDQVYVKNKKPHQRGERWPRLAKMIKLDELEEYPPSVATYLTISAPPSTKPAKKYCDITGYEALYTDPKHGVRYSTPEVFHFIRDTLANDTRQLQDYLALRNAHSSSSH